MLTAAGQEAKKGRNSLAHMAYTHKTTHPLTLHPSRRGPRPVFFDLNLEQSSCGSGAGWPAAGSLGAMSTSPTSRWLSKSAGRPRAWGPDKKVIRREGKKEKEEREREKGRERGRER